MTALVSVLALLAWTAIPTLCLECSNRTNYSVVLTPELKVASNGELVTLTCNTTLPSATFPQWMLDENLYTVTHLPLDFRANESSLQFPFEGDVDIRCVFRILYEGSVINICSNPSRIRIDGARDDFDTDPCQNVNIVSILNKDEFIIVNMVGVIGDEGTCNVSVRVTDCLDSDHCIEQDAVANNESGAVTVALQNANSFYGNDVTVTADTCLRCNQLRYYLPNIRPTEHRPIPRNHVGIIIDEIASSTNCLSRQSIDYSICIHSGGYNACYENPCGNGEVFTSQCPGAPQNNGKVGLGVNGTGNNTIVSIFCTMLNGCAGTITEVLLLNVALLTCDENADYKEGQCVCRENYIGNGIVCREQKVPPQPRELSLTLDCSTVPVEDKDSRPNVTGVISWMDGEREEGVVYPGDQRALVEPSSPGETVCSYLACNSNIHPTKEGFYTVSLTLTNDAGSSDPISLSFNTMVFQTANNLDGDRPSVTVTVNEHCSSPLDVTVSFGLREKGRDRGCDDIRKSQSATLAPDVAMTFYVDKTLVVLRDGYEYCFTTHLQGESRPPSPSATEGEGLSAGAIAGIVISAVVVVVVVVVSSIIVGILVYYKPWRRQQRELPKANKKTELKFTHDY